MSQQNNGKTKWIALSALILFALSGGVYRLATRNQSDSGNPDTAAANNPPAVSNPLAVVPSHTDQAIIGAVSGNGDAPSPQGVSPGATTTTVTGTETVTPTNSTLTSNSASNANPTAGNGIGSTAAANIAATSNAASSNTSVASGGSASAVKPATIGSTSNAATTTGSLATHSTGSVANIATGPSLLNKLTFGFLGSAGRSASAPSLGLGTTTAGTNGTAGPGATLVAKTNVPVAATPVPIPPDQCLTVTFRHKNLAAHTDEESCSHHKNQLKLQGSDINSKSVCVRVNGIPVHYLSVKGHNDEVIFGAVAGPKSKVTVRYCTGKRGECAKFNEDCTVPKDEFMEAIGGGADDSKDARLGQWDPSNPSAKESDVMARLDGAVKKELETNDDLNGRAPAGELFKDWIGEVASSACVTQQASN